MTPKRSDDSDAAGLRVARFGEVEPDPPEGPAPVARFGEPSGGESAGELPGAASRAQLDRIGEHVAAQVASIREHGGRAGAAAAAPVAADVHDEPASRAATEHAAEPDDGSGGASVPVNGRARARRTERRGSFGRRGGVPGAVAELDPDADPVVVAREICLRLLTGRARTRQELAQAMRGKGVPDEVAGSVLGRFDEVGLIDDAAFAGQWVRSRHNSKGLARRAIAMELRRKGVDDEVAGEALAEVDTESEETRARELVDRKLRTMPAATPEQRKKAAPRLVGMLARKGYGGGVAYRVVREALAAHGAEIDELESESPD